MSSATTEADGSYLDSARRRAQEEPGHLNGFSLDRNIRELGGLASRDGRRVRHGLLYRGSALCDLSEQERHAVDDMGLKLVFDLRSRFEATDAPDYVPDGAHYERMAGMRWDDGEEVDFSPAGIDRLYREFGNLRNLDEGMARLYSTMIHDVPAFKALITHMANGGAPLYFHCTAGKDRTGMAAALMLTALGVPEPTIMTNYLATNDYRAAVIQAAAAAAPPEQREMIRMANGVQEETLRAIFDAIDAEYPTREDYLADEYDLSQADLEEMRALYLE